MADEKLKTTDMPVPGANEMAIERTMMAAERTIMAWTRTSISLISFGFTIYKFLQYMQAEGKTVALTNPDGPETLVLL